MAPVEFQNYFRVVEVRLGRSRRSLIQGLFDQAAVN